MAQIKVGSQNSPNMVIDKKNLSINSGSAKTVKNLFADLTSSGLINNQSYMLYYHNIMISYK